MKKSIMLAAAAFMLAMPFASCKDKNSESATEADQIENPADNTRTQTDTLVTDTVPGVESGVGDEQIP